MAKTQTAPLDDPPPLLSVINRMIGVIEALEARVADLERDRDAPPPDTGA